FSRVEIHIIGVAKVDLLMFSSPPDHVQARTMILFAFGQNQRLANVPRLHQQSLALIALASQLGYVVFITNHHVHVHYVLLQIICARPKSHFNALHGHVHGLMNARSILNTFPASRIRKESLRVNSFHADIATPPVWATASTPVRIPIAVKDASAQDKQVLQKAAVLFVNSVLCK